MNNKGNMIDVKSSNLVCFKEFFLDKECFCRFLSLKLIDCKDDR